MKALKTISHQVTGGVTDCWDALNAYVYCHGPQLLYTVYRKFNDYYSVTMNGNSSTKLAQSNPNTERILYFPLAVKKRWIR